MQVYKLHDSIMNNLESTLKTLYDTDVYDYDENDDIAVVHQELSNDLYNHLFRLVYVIGEGKQNEQI